MSPRSSGRPPGTESTRATILEAARAAFAASGYGGASMRSIATAAGVDASTVVHFFGSKEGLFRAVIESARTVMRPVLAAMVDGEPGEEVVRRYLALWSDPATGPLLLAVVRTGIGSEDAVGVLREALIERVMEETPEEQRLGVTLTMTHLIGLGIGLHVGQAPHLVAARDRLPALVGPTVDAYRRLSD